MLQGVEPEISEVGNGLARSHHGKNAAGFLGLVRTILGRWVPLFSGRRE
jgi:hypothetical protein